MARPKTGKYDIDTMIDIITKYTDSTALPIVKEVCYLNDWNYDYVMQLQRANDSLSQSIKRLVNKKEVVLEKNAMDGTFDKTMAIFSLKQLGWRDRLDTENKVEFENDGFIEALTSKATETLEKLGDAIET